MRCSVICFVLIASALTLGGCVSASDVAHEIITAPNEQSNKQAHEFFEAASPLYSKQIKVPVGPPPAKLAVAILAPRNYGFSASAEWKKNPETLLLKWRIHGNPVDENGKRSKGGKPSSVKGTKAIPIMRRMFGYIATKLPVCRATGTVLLLPGWGEAKETLLGYALDLANHGYRVVLVDLRGQGQSSGKYVTYGLIEHRDISQVITALYKRKLVAGKLALVGVSEGATIALDTAAADKRLAAVVAVAPFVNLKTAIRATANEFMPHLSKAVSKKKLARALVIADQRLGMNLADTNPTTRVGRIQAPVLYIAGGKDKISPAAEVKTLAEKTPNSQFLEIPRYPHIAMYFGVAKVGPPILAALARAMGKPSDPTCLAAPPPKDMHYNFPFIVTLKKR